MPKFWTASPCPWRWASVATHGLGQRQGKAQAHGAPQCPLQCPMFRSPWHALAKESATRWPPGRSASASVPARGPRGARPHGTTPRSGYRSAHAFERNAACVGKAFRCCCRLTGSSKQGRHTKSVQHICHQPVINQRSHQLARVTACLRQAELHESNATPRQTTESNAWFVESCRRSAVVFHTIGPRKAPNK